jgi:hypothetical protein
MRGLRRELTKAEVCVRSARAWTDGVARSVSSKDRRNEWNGPITDSRLGMPEPFAFSRLTNPGF